MDGRRERNRHKNERVLLQFQEIHASLSEPRIFSAFHFGIMTRFHYRVHLDLPMYIWISAHTIHVSNQFLETTNNSNIGTERRKKNWTWMNWTLTEREREREQKDTNNRWLNNDQRFFSTLSLSLRFFLCRSVDVRLSHPSVLFILAFLLTIFIVVLVMHTNVTL